MPITGSQLSASTAPALVATGKAAPARFAAPGKGGVANNGLIRENESIASVGKEAVVYSIPRSSFQTQAPTVQTAIETLIGESSRAWTGIGAQEATV